MQTFEKWMSQSGLSDATVNHYAGAIDGSLSEWARDASIFSPPLRTIQQKLQFDEIAVRIQELPIFKERNSKGNSMYSAAIKKYSEYLSTLIQPFDKESNYVLYSSSNNKYLATLSDVRIKHFFHQFGDAFNIIMSGDLELGGDFYAIPYSILKPALTENYRTEDKNSRLQWTASIRNHQLLVGCYPVPIDVSAYYGNYSILDSAIEPLTKDEENDYGIENRKIEIEQRQKQSVFRKRVLENFDDTCCLTGFKESNLLIASHIIPWRSRVDTRLHPSNGLLLFAGYDRMFDQGYFSFDDNLCVIVPSDLNKFSVSLRDELLDLSGRQASSPNTWPIKHEFLQYHREQVFSEV